MRKISIGIFAIATAILFILSTSISVTAATHRETLMILGSNVDDDAPRASVSMDPQDVWSYAVWNWTLDISNGDDVIIDTTCNWLNGNLLQTDSGYHYYSIFAVYTKGLDTTEDSDWHEEKTDGSVGGVPEQGSTTITATLSNLDEGGKIDITWYVQAINKYSTPWVDADMLHLGTITLT